MWDFCKKRGVSHQLSVPDGNQRKLFFFLIPPLAGQPTSFFYVLKHFKEKSPTWNRLGVVVQRSNVQDRKERTILFEACCEVWLSQLTNNVGNLSLFFRLVFPFSRALFTGCFSCMSVQPHSTIIYLRFSFPVLVNSPGLVF
ncbi:hypothetical protein NPIL_503821 [Nephila pilipes]|uniref:Uncharacterized protein n=1 Tax=Nephila pilipes TaxID=299642 RepID=A0A8X6TTQ4_NEPPI|nr:hypothetical protein NPIL_503821 [Nephila pilipes]